MKILVDTQCWLWLQAAPEKFSRPTLDLLSAPETELLLSAASAWEIAIKYELGKLPLPVTPSEYVPSRMRASGTTALPVLHGHALRVATLPPLHRDPFDRLIIAQAQHEGVSVLTTDDIFGAYGVDLRRP